MKNLRRLLDVFRKEEKRRFIWLFLAILITGLLEISGVASILPLMELVADPGAIDNSRWLTAAYDFFGFTSHKEMLISFGIAVIVLLGLTSFFSMFTVWLQFKYAWDATHALSTRLLRTYLRKPYAYFLQENTSNLQAYIITEIGGLTGGIVLPIIEIISRSFVSIIIFTLLLIIDAKVSLIMFGTLGGAYFLIYISRKNFLRKMGEHRVNMSLLRYKSLGEIFTGMKTVKVYNADRFFYDRYDKASKAFCDVQPKFNITIAAPRYILEFLAFGGILGVTIYLFVSTGNIQNTIPRLTLYVVAGYRLLPALQKIFGSFAKLRHNMPILEKLYADLVLSLENQNEIKHNYPPLPFDEAIHLSQITYAYENTAAPVLNNLDIVIPKGHTVAFTGSTGAGKTTLVDIIVGLLDPSKGKIIVDNHELQREDINHWRENIAYVPQDVFLFDDTVMHNITLGSNRNEIDNKRLEEAAKTAGIYQFIITELADGFETKIGERGIRLSGGQRQRIGLARAIYAQPSILVLDEATSALDGKTEKGIIESLKSLPEELTTIVIAHRLSTVKHADCIYVLKDGEVSAKGSFESLENTNESFKEMIQLS